MTLLRWQAIGAQRHDGQSWSPQRAVCGLERRDRPVGGGRAMIRIAISQAAYEGIEVLPPA
jgi:hypothetical protein